MDSIHPLWCWSLECFFFFHCWIFHIDMRTAGSSVSQRRDKRSVGIECKGRDKFFSASFTYDQHRRSAHLRGTECYSLPETTRSNMYHSVCSETPQQVHVYCHTTGDRFPPQPRLWIALFCIFNIFYIFCISHQNKNLETGLTVTVRWLRSGLRLYIYLYNIF